MRDNVLTAKLHPTSTAKMDKNVIQVVKSHYKKGILCSVINQNDDIIQCLKRTNLKGICMAKCTS
jgi:hypothetical protein